MTDMKTTYMGLELKNPVIAGASGLTATIDSIKRLEEAGVAAVVTKSLFEEQIQLERFKFDEDQEKDNYRYAEMITMHPHLKFAGPDEHLMWVRKTKEAVGIPVIASLNAVNHETWLDYAGKLEQTGVDALECNLFATPKAFDKDAATVEREQVELVTELKKVVSIPVSLKLSFFYTNPLNVIQHLDQAGVDGLVLFNRTFEPDMDIEKKEHIAPFNFSNETDYRLPLRYAGILEGHVKADICCSTGIFSAASAIKMILAGASAIQVVSALFVNSYEHVAAMTANLGGWMERNGYKSIAEFKGKMSKRHNSDPWVYTRAHYAQLLMDPKPIIQNYPTM